MAETSRLLNDADIETGETGQAYGTSDATKASTRRGVGGLVLVGLLFVAATQGYHSVDLRSYPAARQIYRSLEQIYL